jgi:hypothetical protein
LRSGTIIAVGMAFAALGGRVRGDANIYGSLNGQRIVGNETYVTITNVWNEMDALPLAESHGAKYGKVARYVRMEGPKAIFNCLDK